MFNFIKNHKKFTASCLASILALIGLLAGLGITEVMVIVAPLGFGYPLSQGLADFGKEGEKIKILPFGDELIKSNWGTTPTTTTPSNPPSGPAV